MIPILTKLLDKLSISYPRTDSPSQKTRIKTKLKGNAFQVGNNTFSNTIANGNGRDGVHINMGTGTIAKEDLSTHQRLAVEELRERWSLEHNLSRSVNLYGQQWETGELEWVNQQLRDQGKSWRVE